MNAAQHSITDRAHTTYLTPHVLSERWQVATTTLANWRSRGEGPTYIKVGASVRYALADIESFELRTRTEAVA